MCKSTKHKKGTVAVVCEALQLNAKQQFDRYLVPVTSYLEKSCYNHAKIGTERCVVFCKPKACGATELAHLSSNTNNSIGRVNDY